MNSTGAHKTILKVEVIFRVVLYLSLVISSHESKSQSNVLLCLIPINEVKKENIIILQDSLESYFNINTKIGNKKKYAAFKELMSQEVIYAKPLLDSLEKYFKVDEAEKIIFITNKKLASREMPSVIGSLHEFKYLLRGFVTNIPGSFGIVSTYKLKKESESNLHFKHLLVKTVRHEFGHLLGLHHCINKNCLMKSGFDPTIFQNINYKICEKCQELLQKNNQFYVR